MYALLVAITCFVILVLVIGIFTPFDAIDKPTKKRNSNFVIVPHIDYSIVGCLRQNYNYSVIKDTRRETIKATMAHYL